MFCGKKLKILKLLGRCKISDLLSCSTMFWLVINRLLGEISRGPSKNQIFVDFWNGSVVNKSAVTHESIQNFLWTSYKTFLDFTETAVKIDYHDHINQNWKKSKYIIFSKITRQLIHVKFTKLLYKTVSHPLNLINLNIQWRICTNFLHNKCYNKYYKCKFITNKYIHFHIYLHKHHKLYYTIIYYTFFQANFNTVLILYCNIIFIIERILWLYHFTLKCQSRANEATNILHRRSRSLLHSRDRVAWIFICRMRMFIYLFCSSRSRRVSHCFVSDIYWRLPRNARRGRNRHIVSVFCSSPCGRLIGSPPTGMIRNSQWSLLNESGICLIFETSSGYCVASHRLYLLYARTMKQRSSASE